jgi:hypothetical protein
MNFSFFCRHHCCFALALPRRYQTCTDIATARDPTRFTTWASDKDLNDKCLAAASLVSFNNYPGWHVLCWVTSVAPCSYWSHGALI